MVISVFNTTFTTTLSIFLIAIFNLLLSGINDDAYARKKNSTEASPILTAGNIRAELPLQKKGKNFSRGSYAFTEIKLFNQGKTTYASGKLILETEGMRVQSISNLNNQKRNKTKIRKKKNQHIVTVHRLHKNTPMVLWLELKLNERPDSIGTLLESRIKITLQTDKKKKSISDSTYIRWRIANCAESYHLALTHLEKDNLSILNNALKSTRTTNNELTGKWLFSPSKAYTTKVVQTQKCRRYRKYWNKRKGKWNYKCRTYKKVTKQIRTPTPEYKKLKQLYQSSSALVYARGKAPGFQRNAGNYWVTRKISEDLKRYLTQKPNPAICTGANQMTGYYVGKFKQVITHSKKWNDTLITAKKLALLNIETFINSISNNNTKAYSQEKLQKISLILEQQDIPENKLFSSQQLLNNLLNRLKNEGYSIKFPEETGFYDKLKAFREKTSAFKEEEKLNEEAIKKLTDALFVIEATYYLERLQSQYNKVITSFNNNVNGIKKSHEEHCTCNN